MAILSVNEEQGVSCRANEDLDPRLVRSSGITANEGTGCWRNLHISTCKCCPFEGRPLRPESYADNRSIRFAPPLVISEEDIRRAVGIIGECLEEFDTVSLFSQW